MRRNKLDPALQQYAERYRTLFDLVPVAVYACDADGVIQEYNRRAAELWGCEPGNNGWAPRFCGSYKIYYPDGRLMPHEDCPMARLLRGEKLKPKDLKIIVERPDGKRRHVVPTPSVLRDDRGKIIGAINCLHDITEREEAERTKARLAAIVESSEDAILSKDLNGIITSWNQGAQQLFGYTAREAIGQSVTILMPPDRIDEEPEILDRIRRGESVEHYETVRRRKNGSKLNISLTVSPIIDAHGNIIGASKIARDVTDRRNADEKLAWLAAYPRENPNPILEVDWKKNEIYYANPAALESFPDLKKRGMRHPLLRKVLEKVKPLVEGKAATLQSEIDVGTCHYAVAVVRVSGTRRLRIYSIDITQRKKQEDRLTEQARLLNLTHDAIIVRDRRDRIVYWNDGAEAMYGYKREEALGKITHELLRSQHPENLQSIRHRLARDDHWSGEINHVRRDGKQITVLSRWSLDRDSHGQHLFILETNTDITKVKKAEAELQRSKEMLEKLVQQRTRALRIANAELENEITRRKGLEGQILEISDREQERLGQELHDGLCQQLTAIGFLARATALRLKDHRVVQVDDLERIAQLINASVMDARNIARDLHKEEIDAAEFDQALRDLAERKIWRTSCRLELKTKVNLEDDNVASQLYRILREAIINANKHARAKQIVLAVKRLKNELVFSVTDDGVGLNTKTKGQGLGFHIMKYRAESIGARVELQSLKKGGTRMACYLPIELTE